MEFSQNIHERVVTFDCSFKNGMRENLKEHEVWDISFRVQVIYLANRLYQLKCNVYYTSFVQTAYFSNIFILNPLK